MFKGQRFAILAMFLFFLEKVVELVDGGSVINGACRPLLVTYLITFYLLEAVRQIAKPLSKTWVWLPLIFRILLTRLRVGRERQATEQ